MEYKNGLLFFNDNGKTVINYKEVKILSVTTINKGFINTIIGIECIAIEGYENYKEILSYTDSNIEMNKDLKDKDYNDLIELLKGEN